MLISRRIILRMKNASGKICRENKKSTFYEKYFFFSENRAVYRIMWENVAKPNCGVYTIFLLNQTLGSARQNCSVTVILLES